MPRVLGVSGLLICDGRHATGRAGMVIRRAFADGGAQDHESLRGQLRTLFPVDSLAAADVALLRTGDREWYVVKARDGRSGQTLGPEAVSELLAVQRREELGLPAEHYDPITGQPLRYFDADRVRAATVRGQEIHDEIMGLAIPDRIQAAREYLEEQINTGRLCPDGSDITVHFKAMEINGTEVAPAADVKFPAVFGLPLPAPVGPGQPAQPLQHANDAYVRAEKERLARQGLTRQDVLRDGYNTKPRTDGGKA